MIEATATVLPVRIDVDKEPLVARKYEVAAMPKLVFADSPPEEISRPARE